MIHKNNVLQAVLVGMMCIVGVSVQTSTAQEYHATPVTISKDKIRANDGKIYYSHVVLEKQTLYSIAKTYGVSIDEIYEANPTLNLKTEGVKANAIILIPYKKETGDSATEDKPLVTEKTVEQAPAAQTSVKETSGKKVKDYFIHVVKWYEDLGDIAKKYDISKKVIMKFNSLTSEKLKNRQKLKIPYNADGIDISENDTADIAVEPEYEDRLETIPAQPEEEKKSVEEKAVSSNQIVDKHVRLLMMLPFNAQGNPSSSSMDFYSGALLALKDLQDEGISSDISVYDVANNSMPVTRERLSNSDFSIGPIDTAALKKVLELAPSSTGVISPLDPKGLSLVPQHSNLVQAPSSTEAQYRELLNWLKEDRKSGDKVIVINEKSARTSSHTALMTKLLAEILPGHTVYSYNILEGRNVPTALSGIMSANSTNRVIINSESEAFVNDVVRNLDLMVYRKFDVVLYGQSKIRSFDTIAVENLHNLNAHIATSYYIDYDSPKVTDFLLAFRALYGTEPNQFSFQGYDITYYFVKMRALYGNDWMEMLCCQDKVAMFQTDFHFSMYGDGGYFNQGVRRIVYKAGFGIEIQS